MEFAEKSSNKQTGERSRIPQTMWSTSYVLAKIIWQNFYPKLQDNERYWTGRGSRIPRAPHQDPLMLNIALLPQDFGR